MIRDVAIMVTVIDVKKNAGINVEPVELISMILINARTKPM